MKPNSLLRSRRRIVHSVILALALAITLLAALAVSGVVMYPKRSPASGPIGTDQTAHNVPSAQAAPISDMGTPVKPSPGNHVAASIVHIDPQIGRPTPPPPNVRDEINAALAFDPGFSTSSEGLRAVPSQVEGGGIMIDLQGRFLSSATATMDPNEQIAVRP